MLIASRGLMAGVTLAAGSGILFALILAGTIKLPFGGGAGAVTVYDAHVSFPEQLSALDEPVSHIAVDPAGNAWFATFANSVNLYTYSPTVGTVQSFPLPYDLATGAASGIQVAPNGHIIVGYGHTIVDFDPRTSKETHVKMAEKVQYPVETAGALEGTWISAIAVGPDAYVYAGRMNAGEVTEVDPLSGAMVEHRLPATFGPVFSIQVAGGDLLLTNWLGVGFDGQTLRYNLSADSTVSVDSIVTTSAVSADGSVYGVSLDGQIVGIDSKATGVGPDQLKPHIGGDELLSYDSSANSLWVTGDSQSTIYKWGLTTNEVAGYQLPSQVIPGSLTRCIGRTEKDCPDVVVRTLVGALAPDGKGNLYFADQTQNRIGILRPDN